MKKIMLSGLLLSSIAFAIEPFGVKLGENIDKNIVLKETDNQQYIINPTKKVSFFDLYSAKEFKNKVFLVNAISPIEKSKYCSNTKLNYNELKGLLIKKYGKPIDDYNNLRSGSYWDKASDYQSSLRTKDRFVYSSWDIENISITMMQNATYSGCYLRIEYLDNKLSKDKDSHVQSNDSLSL